MTKAAIAVGEPLAPAATESPGRFAELLALLRTEFVRDVAGTYASRVLVLLLGAATTVIVARMLGPEGRGLFAVAVALGALGVQFGCLGLTASNTYYVARDRKLLPRLLANALAVSLVVGGTGAAAAGIVFWLFPEAAPAHGLLLAFALIWIPVGIAYTLTQLLMLGIAQVRRYNFIEVGHRGLALTAIGVLALTGIATPLAFFLATFAAILVACAANVLSLRSATSAPLQPSMALFRATMTYGLKAYLAAFFAFLVLRADLLMVKYLLGAEPAGQYSIAVALADYLALLPPVVAALLFPKLSALADVRLKLRLAFKATAGTAALLLPIVALSMLLAPALVRLLFGDRFLPAADAFIWLMPGMLFLGVQTVIVQFLNSIGFPWSVVVIWGGSSILNIAACWWAIPRFGIEGAAVVSTGSYALAFLLVLALVYRTKVRLERPAAAN